MTGERAPLLGPDAPAAGARWSATATTSYVVAGIAPAGRVIGLLAPALSGSFLALACGSLVLALLSLFFWRLSPREA